MSRDNCILTDTKRWQSNTKEWTLAQHRCSQHRKALQQQSIGEASLSVSQHQKLWVVFANVCLEVTLLSGSVRTVTTGKGFLSGVGSEVVHEIGWGYGEIAAVGALKFLDVTSPRSDVTLCLLFIRTCTLGANTHQRRPPPAVLLLQVHHHSLLKDAQLSK